MGVSKTGASGALVVDSEYDLEPLLAGIVGLDQGADGLEPRRFSPRQMEHFRSNEAFQLRSRCSAGVRLELSTDASALTLHYTLSQGARDWAYFDLFVDGAWVAGLGSEPSPADSGIVRFELPADGAMHHLTLHLPHCQPISLRAMELESATQCLPAPKAEKNLLCIGDSITQGMDARHPSNAYPSQLARFFGMNLINQGVGGYYFDRTSLSSDLEYQPDWITVAYGTNDWSRCRSISQFRLFCAEYLTGLSALYPHAKIYVLTPIWRSDRAEVKPGGAFEELASSIRRIVSDFPSMRVIEGLELVPHIPALYPDAKVHPGDEGLLHYSLNLARRIRELS